MRILAGVLLAPLLCPLQARAQDDPCGGVTCSNHGACVTKDGNPVCACHEGYYPDETTGLSCLPMSTHPSEAARAAAEEAGAVDRAGLKGQKGLATAGMALTSVALALSAGKVIDISLGLAGIGNAWSIIRAWFGMHTAEMALHGAGVPMALVGAMAIRKNMGLKPATKLNVAAWVMFGSTWLIHLFSIIPLSNISQIVLTYVDIAFIAVSAGLAIADAMDAIRRADRFLVGGVALMPFMASVRGGAVLGISGTF